MKPLLLGIAVWCGVSLSAPLFADPASPLDRLAFLEGDWVRQSRRGEVTERWTRVSPQTMEGVAFLGSGDAMQITEHLRLEAYGEQVFYIAKPGENPFPTAFELVQSEQARFVFENPEHDFPQRILYERRGDNELLVRIEGTMQGETRQIDFPFVRVTASSR